MKTLLIVEDDHLVRKVLEIRLEQTLPQVKILSAIDGGEAVRKIRGEKPDVLLLDLMLPDKPGFEIMEEFQGDIRQKKMLVFVVSNLSGKQDMDRAMSLGATSFFIKSDVDASKISDEVKKYL